MQDTAITFEQLVENKPKVNFDLQSVDSNAFMLMGSWARQARREKWTQEEIKVVQAKCMSGDYDNLVGTLMQVCV